MSSGERARRKKREIPAREENPAVIRCAAQKFHGISGKGEWPLPQLVIGRFLLAFMRPFSLYLLERFLS